MSLPEPRGSRPHPGERDATQPPADAELEVLTHRDHKG
jgi:hypothetical protein